MRRGAFVGLAALVVAGVVIAAVWVTSTDDAPAQAASTTSSVATETDSITRQTLQQTEEFDASVGYGESFALPGSAFGTVTWVPDEGVTLEPGAMVYKTDEKPTYWTRGDVPMYRTLQKNSSGADVEQLERYLQAGGYLGPDDEIDGEFDATLRTAVKAWQDDRGLKDTGRIDSSQLLFLPYEAIRVSSVPRVGEAAAGGVLEVTSPELFVSAEVSANKKKAFEGDPVIQVELADGSTYAASVDTIKAAQSQDPFGEQKFKVKLALQAPTGQEPGEATVEVIDVLAADVLAAPVRALLALTEGGYAVQVIQSDGSYAYVSVEIGEFADGWVEIAGDVSEGDEVVVPA